MKLWNALFVCVPNVNGTVRIVIVKSNSSWCFSFGIIKSRCKTRAIHRGLLVACFVWVLVWSSKPTDVFIADFITVISHNTSKFIFIRESRCVG